MTIGASFDQVLDGFCGEEITAPGVWYSLVGTGHETAVGLCDGTDYDTKISVFEGSCDDLICIGGNDDFCDFKSAFSWIAEVGVTYYILVSDFSPLLRQAKKLTNFLSLEGPWLPWPNWEFWNYCTYAIIKILHVRNVSMYRRLGVHSPLL
jgi:hypothetical protein